MFDLNATSYHCHSQLIFSLGINIFLSRCSNAPAVITTMPALIITFDYIINTNYFISNISLPTFFMAKQSSSGTTGHYFCQTSSTTSSNFFSSSCLSRNQKCNQVLPGRSFSQHLKGQPGAKNCSECAVTMFTEISQRN